MTDHRKREKRRGRRGGHISLFRLSNTKWSHAAKKGRAREDPDAELVRAAKEGDTDAFSQLVVRHQTHVYTLACALLGNETEAQDAAQEVFLNLFRSIKKFRWEALFSTYVTQAVRNHCVNRGKRLSWWRKRVSPLPDDQEVPISAPHSDPPAQVGYTQLQKELARALDKLPYKYREVVVLYGIEGMSHAAIADLLGVKEGTVRARLSRGRALLKESLTPYFLSTL